MKYIFIVIDRVFYTLLTSLLGFVFTLGALLYLLVMFLYDFKKDKECIYLLKDIKTEVKKGFTFKIGFSDFMVRLGDALNSK